MGRNGYNKPGNKKPEVSRIKKKKTTSSGKKLCINCKLNPPHDEIVSKHSPLLQSLNAQLSDAQSQENDDPSKNPLLQQRMDILNAIKLDWICYRCARHTLLFNLTWPKVPILPTRKTKTPKTFSIKLPRHCDYGSDEVTNCICDRAEEWNVKSNIFVKFYLLIIYFIRRKNFCSAVITAKFGSMESV